MATAAGSLSIAAEAATLNLAAAALHFAANLRRDDVTGWVGGRHFGSAGRHSWVGGRHLWVGGRFSVAERLFRLEFRRRSFISVWFSVAERFFGSGFR